MKKSLMHRLASSDITGRELEAIEVALQAALDAIEEGRWNERRYGGYFTEVVRNVAKTRSPVNRLPLPNISRT